MVNSDLGLTLVFNGCIYNHEDLRPRSSKPPVTGSSLPRTARW